MSVCVNGFAWVRKGNGYECKGGTHMISDAEVEARQRQ